jgi:polyribonucleotide nucleotidyltransferase
MMVEGEMEECSEEEMVEAIKFAHEFIKKQCDAQEKLAKAFGKKETREYDLAEEDEELMKKVNDFTYKKCYDVAKQGLIKS